MTQSLPERANLRQLRLQAKDLTKAVREANPSAVDRVRYFVGADDVGVLAGVRFSLRDAQRLLAHEYGFSTWSELVAEVVKPIRRDYPPELQALLKAVTAPDPDRVAAILDAHPELVNRSVHDESVEGEMLLHRAVPWPGVEETDQHVQVANVLIDRGADVDIIGWPNNNELSAPLMVCAWLGRCGVGRALLDAGADPNLPDQSEKGGRPIDTASGHGHDEFVELLIEYGASFELRHLVEAGLNERAKAMLVASPESAAGDPDSEGNRPALHAAIESGNAEMVTVLLNAGADPSSVDSLGCNALHEAIVRSWRNDDAPVRLLQKHVQADIWAASGLGDAARVHDLLARDGSFASRPQNDGLTPVFWAMAGGSAEVVDALVRAGASVNVSVDRWWYSWTPLFTGLVLNRGDAVRRLLAGGADPNFKGVGPNWGHDHVPLHVAARFCGLDIIGALLDHGADINGGAEMAGGEYIGSGGFTWAVWVGSVEKTRFFVERGVDVNHPNHLLVPHAISRNAPRHMNEYVEIIELLAKAGANFYRRNELGQTPLAMALERHGETDVSRAFRDAGAVI